MKYHILNGDALKVRLPQLEGEIIVLRECLIEGDKSGETWEDFLESRNGFLNKFYNTTSKDYENKSIVEFKKIKNIPINSEVYFWFEDDLFCQVNFWFACSLLVEKDESISCFFVRSKSTELNGFGGMKTAELISSFETPMFVQVADVKLFKSLWFAFKNENFEALKSLTFILPPHFDFVKNAIEACLKMNEIDSKGLNYYERKIHEMITRNEDITFVEVFQQFNKTNSILGLGDLQVKRMYDRVKSNV